MATSHSIYCQFTTLAMYNANQICARSLFDISNRFINRFNQQSRSKVYQSITLFKSNYDKLILGDISFLND